MTPAQVKMRRGVIRAKITRLKVKKAEVAVEIAEALKELATLVIDTPDKKAKKKATKK